MFNTPNFNIPASAYNPFSKPAEVKVPVTAIEEALVELDKAVSGIASCSKDASKKKLKKAEMRLKVSIEAMVSFCQVYAALINAEDKRSYLNKIKAAKSVLKNHYASLKATKPAEPAAAGVAGSDQSKEAEALAAFNESVSKRYTPGMTVPIDEPASTPVSNSAVDDEAVLLNGLKKPVVAYLAKIIDEALEFNPSEIFKIAKEYGEAVMRARERMTPAEVVADGLSMMVPELVRAMSTDDQSAGDIAQIDAIVFQMDMIRDRYVAEQVRLLQQAAEATEVTPGETELAREVNSVGKTSQTVGRTRNRTSK